MKIFILGTGRMGAWLTEEFCLDHEVAIYDFDRKKMKFFIEVQRLTEIGQLKDFNPDMVINAVSLRHTKEAFDQIIPLVSDDCILVDIMSVKCDIDQYYKQHNMRFVSIHPMFGPTFANIRNLKDENAVIISESDEKGKKFFRDFFESLELNIYEYSFAEHDQTISYSLSIPFTSSLVFAACMKKQDAPGTTFRRHHDIAKGLLSEDDYLLAEILFNAGTIEQIEKINQRLSYLTHIIRGRDYEVMVEFLNKLRDNIDF
jgi:prephenate dehydrogenase